MDPIAGATPLGGDDGSAPNVWLKDGVVHRVRRPSSSAVHAVLRHLETTGFTGAPQVVGSGFDRGYETLTHLEGDSPHPGPWSDAAIEELGQLVRRFHDAMRSFRPPAKARWEPWFLRSTTADDPIIGHGDLGPWNIVGVGGRPHHLIDWEYAGPVDAVSELAQVAWLNCQLHDDDVAALNGLGSADERARQLRSLVDSYGLPRRRRTGFVDRMIEVAVRDAANDARKHVTPSTRTGVADDGYPFAWGLAWRVRSAAWMFDHRALLEAELSRPG